MWVLVLGLGFYSALLLLLSPLLPVLFARFPAVLLRRPRGLLLLLLWSAPSVGYLALVLRYRPRSPSARRYVDGSGRRSASPLHQPLLASRTARGCSLIMVGCFFGSWFPLPPHCLASLSCRLSALCALPSAVPARAVLLLWSAPSVGLLGARSLPSAPFALARRYVDGYGRQSASPLHQPLLASRTRTGLFLSSWLVASWVLVSSPASLLGLPFLPALCALPSAVPARAVLLLWAAPSVGSLGARSLPSAPFALVRRYVDGSGRPSRLASPDDSSSTCRLLPI
jgi:hypothetical protein